MVMTTAGTMRSGFHLIDDSSFHRILPVHSRRSARIDNVAFYEGIAFESLHGEQAYRNQAHLPPIFQHAFNRLLPEAVLNLDEVLGAADRIAKVPCKLSAKYNSF
jgi:hypothetical protein